MLMCIGVAAVSQMAYAQSGTPISIYGAWHCGNDACDWSSVRTVQEFDSKNHWLVDRGDGVPSVNLVVLSFVNPLELLSMTNNATTSQGIPIGMTQEIINYFKDKDIRVMLSIGGITYVKDWNRALATDPAQLGVNAAYTAHRLGVGIEIDYEEARNPNLEGLETFIDAYRNYRHTDGIGTQYDPIGVNPAARLTIDLAAGDRWLIDLTRKATADWLKTSNPVLDYANAMVASKQFRNARDAQSDWQEHIDGKAQYDPPILPLPPAKFTGSLYITKGRRPLAECVDFFGSLEDTTGEYVQTVAPDPIVGGTPGMLGYMFWAAECPSGRSVCTTPPNDCLGGVGVGAKAYNVPVPMQPLRLQ